ncbi:hypothetical protein DM063_36075 [Klebsiella pneumoniae]|nr:hypothetical protein DM063_36075 [Klebsiella pneumoniae]
MLDMKFVIGLLFFDLIAKIPVNTRAVANKRMYIKVIVILLVLILLVFNSFKGPYLSLLLYQKYCTVVHTIYLNYLKSRQTVILIG